MTEHPFYCLGVIGELDVEIHDEHRLCHFACSTVAERMHAENDLLSQSATGLVVVVLGLRAKYYALRQALRQARNEIDAFRQRTKMGAIDVLNLHRYGRPPALES